MGQNLDKWVEANSRTLALLAPPAGGPTPRAGAIPPAFAPGAQPMPQTGFPGPAAAAGPGGFPAAGGGAPAFEAQAPVAAPVDVQAPPQPAPAPAPKPQPKKEGGGFKEMYDEADPKKIDEAIKVLEETGGVPVEELYEKQTGRPPPQGAKKREIGEFLFEFGLNLLAAPAGLSDVETIGRSAKAAISAGRAKKEAAEERRIRDEDRRIAAEERKLGRADKAFDRAETMARLDLERQRTQAQLDKPVGTFENYVGEDGYMYTYNEQTGEGRRVMVNGKPVKPDPKMNKTTQQRFDTEVRYNLYMSVHGKDAEGQPLAGADLRTAREGALKFANREREYTEDEARRDAVKSATTILAKDTNYTLADPDEQRAMLDDKVAELSQLLMYGSGPKGGQPDPSRLTEGAATPVTNDETGVTELWTLRDGEPVKVSENQVRQ